MADFEQKLAMKSKPRPFSELELAELQRLTFDYFLKETNPENGLVPDSTRQGAPCSIAPTGFSLAAYPVGVERGFMTRDDAISRTLTSLRFFWICSGKYFSSITSFQSITLCAFVCVRIGDKRAQHREIAEVGAGIVVGRLEDEGGVFEFRVLGDAAKCVETDVAFADVPVTVDARVVNGAGVVEVNGADVLQSDCVLDALE